MAEIEVNHLTKDYGHGRGVFDVSLKVEKGVCYGFLGPNGAGKTTTIRHLMGFSKPQQGSCSITGQDCWKQASQLKESLGYLPGEIALPSGMSGAQFLDEQMAFRKVKNRENLDRLIRIFDLDVRQKVDQMSIGERRKLAVVAAFLHDPDILILDEPTSGLDPLMQDQFIDFIVQEKKRGKTILLSSHIFHEVEACCDRISIIKEGRVQADFDALELKQRPQRIYRITFKDKKSYDRFTSGQHQYASLNPGKLRCRVTIDKKQISPLLRELALLQIREFQEIPYTLEDYFMHFYENKPADGKGENQ